jgi:Bacterial RNA polymerase, alpha chain C terminal domain
LKKLVSEGKVRAPLICGRRIYNGDDLECVIAAETSPPLHQRAGPGRPARPDLADLTPEQILASPVLVLNLTSRAFNFICRDQGIQTIGQLVTFSAVDLLRMDKVGRKTVEEIERKLGYVNLKLKD